MMDSTASLFHSTPKWPRKIEPSSRSTRETKSGTAAAASPNRKPRQSERRAAKATAATTRKLVSNHQANWCGTLWAVTGTIAVAIMVATTRTAHASRLFQSQVNVFTITSPSNRTEKPLGDATSKVDPLFLPQARRDSVDRVANPPGVTPRPGFPPPRVYRIGIGWNRKERTRRLGSRDRRQGPGPRLSLLPAEDA